MSFSGGNFGMMALFLVFFALAHLFKAARFYLVLLEQDIPLRRYLFLYSRTTLVNLIIPFKAGEIYRFAAVYHVTDKGDKAPRGATSFLSVCVDRFFDTAALVAIIIPYGLLYGSSIGYVPLFLFAALLIVTLVYLSIPQSYRYLNEYIIMYRRTKRSVSMLKWLEAIREWYDFTRSLIKGRAPLIIIASFMGWGAEFLALRCFFKVMGKGFSAEDFSRYINSLMSGAVDKMAQLYNTLGIIIFTTVTLIFFAMWLSEVLFKGLSRGQRCSKS